MIRFLVATLAAIVLAALVTRLWKKGPDKDFKFFVACVGFWSVIAVKTIPVPIPWGLGPVLGLFWAGLFIAVRRWCR